MSVKRWSFNGYVRLVKPALRLTEKRWWCCQRRNTGEFDGRRVSAAAGGVASSSIHGKTWVFQLSLRVETCEFGRRSVSLSAEH